MILLLAVPAVAAACPTCTNMIAENNRGLAEGMSYSIIGMASMPFLLFGSVAGIFLRAYFKRRKADLQTEALLNSDPARWN